MKKIILLAVALFMFLPFKVNALGFTHVDVNISNQVGTSSASFNTTTVVNDMLSFFRTDGGSYTVTVSGQFVDIDNRVDYYVFALMGNSSIDSTVFLPRNSDSSITVMKTTRNSDFNCLDSFSYCTNTSYQQSFYYLIVPNNLPYGGVMLSGFSVDTKGGSSRILMTSVFGMTNSEYQTFLSNKETNQKLDEVNQNLTDINDTLNDPTLPDSDISSLGTVTGLLPPGPVDSLLNIPFTLTSTVISSLSGSCVPMKFEKLPHSDYQLTLPCFREIIYTGQSELIMNLIGLVPATFILISYFKHLYKKVERATTLQTNSDDEWGVI